jgi:hypothetical protein
LQDWQPPQAEPQQTSLAQNVDAHSVPLPQGPPIVVSVHTLPTQAPTAHSAVSVHMPWSGVSVKISALETALMLLALPPAARTVPSGSSVAVNASRPTTMVGPITHLPVVGL